MTTAESAPQHAAAKDVPEPPPSAPAADPAMIGLPTFAVGAIGLGLWLLGFVPGDAAGGSAVPIIMAATVPGQLIAAVWAAAIGQSAVAGIFGIFAGFWFSFSILVLGLVNGWLGITEDSDVTATLGLFLIAWLATIVVLTLVTLRLPAAFTLLFVLVDVALALVLAGTQTGSTLLLQLGGIAVLAFTAVGVYLFAGSAAVATGGKALPVGSPIVK